MNRTLFAVLAGLTLASATFADSLTEENVHRVNEAIEDAVAAYGGLERLRGLETLIVSTESTDYSVDQSWAAEPPWDQSTVSALSAMDLTKQVFFTHAKNSDSEFETNQVTVIDGESSYQIDYRAGTMTPIADPNFDASSGPLVRVTPALLVRTLHDRATNAWHLGEATVRGETFDVVAFSMTVGPAITLYFDQSTHLLRQSERMFAGAGLVRYEFHDYETIKGIPFNRNFELYLNDQITTERRIASVQVNESFDELLAIDTGLRTVPAAQPDSLSRQEIADGVYLIGGGGTYAMFVDMGDHIVAAGGTAGIPARIESLREAVGDKPIRYAMLSHHHFDHVMGVEAYEAEGATLLTASAHEAIARRAASEPQSLSVDTVDDMRVFEGNGKRVEIIDVGPTAHTEHLLVAWLPEEGILFEADHFSLPTNGTIPPAVTSTRSFAEALARRGLEVDKFASAHSPRVATQQELQIALSRELYEGKDQGD